jgi:hypothetical protein
MFFILSVIFIDLFLKNSEFSLGYVRGNLTHGTIEGQKECGTNIDTYKKLEFYALLIYTTLCSVCFPCILIVESANIASEGLKYFFDLWHIIDITSFVTTWVTMVETISYHLCYEDKYGWTPWLLRVYIDVVGLENVDKDEQGNVKDETYETYLDSLWVVTILANTWTLISKTRSSSLFGEASILISNGCYDLSILIPILALVLLTVASLLRMSSAYSEPDCVMMSTETTNGVHFLMEQGEDLDTIVYPGGPSETGYRIYNVANVLHAHYGNYYSLCREGMFSDFRRAVFNR